MELTLNTSKDGAAILNQMIEEGIIEIQTINVKGSNVIFYSVNTKSNIEYMIAKLYKVSV